MKKLSSIFIIILVLSFLMCGCNTQNNAEVTNETTVEKETAAKESTCTPILYKVKDEQGNVAWLFGAVHIGREEFYPLPDYVINAFDSSNALAIECDNIDFENIFQYMEYTDQSTIKDHIDVQLYDICLDIFEENDIADEVKDSYMPAVWTLYIDRCTYEKIGFEQKYGVDTYLAELAVNSNKKVLEVEGDEIHGKAMAKLSDECQEMMLMSSVNQYCNIELTKSNINSSLDLWAEGDENKLYSMLNSTPQFQNDGQKKLYEEYSNIIVDERNDQMTNYVKKAMKEEKEIFVCIGQSHILSENSVTSQLKDLGYKVERVK